MDAAPLIVVRHRGRAYGAARLNDKLVVTAGSHHRDIKPDERSAYLWLGDRGLIRRKIRRLLERL
jgi:hypothetical protein